ncbi:hypothetical protein ACQP25_44700 (plasmid) [Microtetraspora malaysiensis]|uniref:hypothetical protein n=1 Tax=Microtetraspora malaysiensis TaxID=161358 RepID=UPI003D89C45E
MSTVKRVSSSGISRLLRAAGFPVVYDHAWPRGETRPYSGVKVSGRREFEGVTVSVANDDPAETTALAVKIVEHLRGRGYYVMYSTLQTKRVQAMGVFASDPNRREPDTGTA